QRIVVLSGDQLDALCALGLQSRIVGAALPDGSSDQPSYLGTVVHKLPGVGTRSRPDLAAIKAAKPDLILGSQALTPKLYSALAENAVRIYGTATFPASVLTTVGVDRPAAQRFTDKPYIEVGSADADLANNVDFSKADADVVYVSFDSPGAKDRAPTIFDSDSWRRLAATRDNRVFVVNNEIWQTGEGVIAARGIIDDLRWINAPIN